MFSGLHPGRISHLMLCYFVSYILFNIHGKHVYVCACERERLKDEEIERESERDRDLVWMVLDARDETEDHFSHEFISLSFLCLVYLVVYTEGDVLLLVE